MEQQPPKIDIRLLKITEIPTFIALRNAIDRESEHLIAKTGERKRSFFYSILTILFNRKRTHTFIVWDKDKAVGYQTIVFAKFKKYRRNAYLVIALRKNYRGMGIGSRLMEVGENFARAHHKHRMELEVFSKNKNAIDLYEKRGYLVEGVKKGAVEDEDGLDDVIIMTKAL